MTSKEVFTTTEAARICHISKQKIVNLFDEGEIDGFRIPGAKGSKARARRIPRKALLAFMRECGIPTDALEDTKKRILVVDDDPASIELLCAMFEDDEDVEVETATNGSDAAVAAGAFKPDLILLDIMLPDLDGDEVLTSIRKTGVLDGTKIVVVTALSDAQRRETMLAAGADGYVTKPIDIAELKKRVKEILEVS